MFRTSKTLRRLASAASLLMAVVGLCLQIRRSLRSKRAGQRIINAATAADVARMEGEGGHSPHVHVPGTPG